jgi:hypothetical protein
LHAIFSTQDLLGNSTYKVIIADVFKPGTYTLEVTYAGGSIEVVPSNTFEVVSSGRIG